MYCICVQWFDFIADINEFNLSNSEYFTLLFVHGIILYYLISDGSSYNKNSLIVSETETEEEILFESSKKGKKATEKQSLIQPANSVKNNLSDRAKKTSNIS